VASSNIAEGILPPRHSSPSPQFLELARVGAAWQAEDLHGARVVAARCPARVGHQDGEGGAVDSGARAVGLGGGAPEEAGGEAGDLFARWQPALEGRQAVVEVAPEAPLVDQAAEVALVAARNRASTAILPPTR
jgi:hypothetical protein